MDKDLQQGKDSVLAFADPARCDYHLKIEIEHGATDPLPQALSLDSLEQMEEDLADLDSTDSGDKDDQSRADVNKREELAKTELDDSTDDDSDDSANQKLQDLEKILELDMTSDEDVLHGNLTTTKDMKDSACTERLCHVISALLKAKSQYFYKLFTNADQSSQEKVLNLRLKASEVLPFLKLLELIHGITTLSRLKNLELAQVMMAAEKFEAKSCLNECVAALQNKCKELPRGLLLLPLAAVEAVLSSDGLEVKSEDEVLKFVLKWVVSNYEEHDQRREILDSRLAPLIRYQYLTAILIEKLKAKYPIEEASKFMKKGLDRGLIYKKSPPDWELGTNKGITTDEQPVERAYRRKPVKVVVSQLPDKACIIYLSFKRDECARLSLSPPVRSERFRFNGGSFVLRAGCTLIDGRWCFGLCVNVERAPSDDYYMCMASFRTKRKDLSVIEHEHVWSLSIKSWKPDVYQDIFSMPWEKSMDDNSPCFVDGVLDLIIEITAFDLPNVSLMRRSVRALLRGDR